MQHTSLEKIDIICLSETSSGFVARLFFEFLLPVSLLGRIVKIGSGEAISLFEERPTLFLCLSTWLNARVVSHSVDATIADSNILALARDTQKVASSLDILRSM